MQLDWSTIVQFAGVLLALLSGVLSVPVINLLKKVGDVDGRLAQLVTVVVAVLMALLSLIVTGAVSPEPLTADYLITLFGAVLLASQAEYWRLKKLVGDGEPEPPETAEA
jgi:drug/metabolite transporter (DMT)-like permease